jgi:hypothetical protein
LRQCLRASYRYTERAVVTLADMAIRVASMDFCDSVSGRRLAKLVIAKLMGPAHHVHAAASAGSTFVMHDGVPKDVG